MELERAPFDLRECIEVVVDLIGPIAQRKGLEITYGIEPGTPETAVGDASRLRQILLNLLNNAVTLILALVLLSGVDPFVVFGWQFADEHAQPARAVHADERGDRLIFFRKNRGLGVSLWSSTIAPILSFLLLGSIAVVALLNFSVLSAADPAINVALQLLPVALSSLTLVNVAAAVLIRQQNVLNCVLGAHRPPGAARSGATPRRSRRSPRTGTCGCWRSSRRASPRPGCGCGACRSRSSGRPRTPPSSASTTASRPRSLRRSGSAAARCASGTPSPR